MVLSSWKDTICFALVQDSKTPRFGIATQTCMQTQCKWHCVIFHRAHNWYTGATQWHYLQDLHNIWQGAGLLTGTTQGCYLHALPYISTEDK
jgi:hypothetical protein